MPWNQPEDFPSQSRDELSPYDGKWVAILPFRVVISDQSAETLLALIKERDYTINDAVFTFINLKGYQ